MDKIANTCLRIKGNRIGGLILMVGMIMDPMMAREPICKASSRCRLYKSLILRITKWKLTI